MKSNLVFLVKKEELVRLQNLIFLLRVYFGLFAMEYNI